MARALCGLPLITDPNLIVGLERAEDAGVYKLTDELALVQTLDFFTPIVDDPYTFGQTAVVNALSDVYAMGGQPPLGVGIMNTSVNCSTQCIRRALATQLLSVRFWMSQVEKSL